MNIVEKTTVPVQGTKSNRAIIYVPARIADIMGISKDSKVVMQLLDNGQLVIEKECKHEKI